MHRMKALAVAAALIGGLAFGGAVANAQVAAERELIVEKVVVGEASAGFVVQVDCEGFEFQNMFREAMSWELPFLADGSPDPDAAAETLNDWDIVDGAWRYGTADLSPHACSVVETDDGGAMTVSYACDYTAPSAGGEFPADFDPCAPTVEGEQAAVIMPFGPFGECVDLTPECVDSAVLTVTNSFEAPEPTVPPTTAPATTAPEPTVPPTTAPATTPTTAPQLPATGSSGGTTTGIMMALAMLFGGALLVGVARRRVGA